METYTYTCNNGDVKWGFRIFINDTVRQISYEAAGFDTEDEAKESMKGVMEDFGWEVQLRRGLLWLGHHQP